MVMKQALATIGVALLVAGCDVTAAIEQGVGVRGSFERTLTISGPVDLSVVSGSGSISVQPGTGSQVRVIGRITARDSWRGRGPGAEEKVRRLERNPPISDVGNTIKIGDITDEDLRDNVAISYEIVVPDTARVRARSGSGSVMVGDVAGPVNAGTGSGSIKIGKVNDRVTASTGSGSIFVAGANGSVAATTGSGSVDVAQTGAGDVEISTGSGGITIHGAKGAVTASTGSGSIDADGAVAGHWKLHTSSGSVKVTLPPNAAFDLAARTSSGRVVSDHPITMTGTIDRRHLEGKVRGGGPRLELRSSSGSITIR